MIARSRSPTTVETFMLPSSALASSEDSTGVTPLLTEKRGPRDRVRRIRRHYLPGNQPVTEHSNASQVLLDRGSRQPALQLLDVGCHVHGQHFGKAGDALPLVPAQEGPRSPPVSGPRVRVADVDGEELDEPPRGSRPCPGRPRRSFTNTRTEYSMGRIGPTRSSCSAPHSEFWSRPMSTSTSGIPQFRERPSHSRTTTIGMTKFRDMPTTATGRFMAWLSRTTSCERSMVKTLARFSRGREITRREGIQACLPLSL
jgi:hypothetical protein